MMCFLAVVVSILVAVVSLIFQSALYVVATKDRPSRLDGLGGDKK